MAAGLIILTAPDGHIVLINPEAITSMHSKKNDKAEAKMFTPGAECLVNTSDGKFIAVKEECDAIQKMLEQLQ